MENPVTQQRKTYDQITQESLTEMPDMDVTFFVGDYEITYWCLQTHPCQHYVKKNDDRWKRMYADDIHLMIKEDGLKCQHFDEYENHNK
jgi:hypothetical protein